LALLDIWSGHVFEYFKFAVFLNATALR
jgi:hypothetical protein